MTCWLCRLRYSNDAITANHIEAHTRRPWEVDVSDDALDGSQWKTLHSRAPRTNATGAGAAARCSSRL
jgi:hypothetical protein